MESELLTARLQRSEVQNSVGKFWNVLSQNPLTFQTFQQDRPCIWIDQDLTIGDLKTVNLSVPVDLEAAFGQTAPLPRQLLRDTHSDVDYGIDNRSSGLWCDREEPCEKPQLLPGDIDIDIGDSTGTQTIGLCTEPPDSENEYPWFGQEDQSSGSEEDFQAHERALSSKRTHLDVIDEASAPAKRRRSSRRNVLVDDITVLAPLSGIMLLPRKPKRKHVFEKFKLHRGLAPEIGSMLSLERVMEIGKRQDTDDGLEADEVRNSANTESQHQSQITLHDAVDLGFPNSSCLGDTDDDSSPVTPVFDAMVVPRNNMKEGPLQELDPLESQLGKLKENTAVRFEDLVPYKSTSKAIASISFLAALTLATKSSLKIYQEQEEHSEHIWLVAGASIQLPGKT